MTAIFASNAVASLKADVPALADRVAEEEAEWGDQTLPIHYLYGVVFVPAMRAALKSGDEPLLTQIFAHIERLASSPDWQMVDVAFLAVLPPPGKSLSDDAKDRNLDRFIGPETRRLLAWKPGDAPFRPTGS